MWWKENVAVQAHEAFISQALDPGEGMGRVKAVCADEKNEATREDWGAAVTSAENLLGAGAAEI